MERIAIAIQDGGAGAGAQHGDVGREANLILSCRRTSIWDPRGGGLFDFKFSSRPRPRKFGVKRFLVVREVAGAEVGWPVLGLPPLEKIIGGVNRDRLVPPRWIDAAVYRAEVCYPFGRKHGRHCREAAPVHHAARRRGDVAARGARAAA